MDAFFKINIGRMKQWLGCPSRNGDRTLLWTSLASSVFAVLWLCPRPACADDWYRWRGPQLDGISPETNWTSDWPEQQPKIAWTAAVGTGFSSMVVAGERAYTIGHLDGQDTVFCLDATNGQTIWRYGYPAPLDDRDFEGGPTSTPTIDQDRVYVLSRAGEVFCLSASDGTLKWQKQLAEDAELRLPGWGCSGSPLVLGNKLLLNLGESGAALDKHDGKIIWSSADKECGYATPVIVPDTDPATVIFASARAFIGVDSESGEQRWSERWLTSFNCNAADPIVHDGQMFVSSGYNRGAALFQLDGPKPQLIWKNKEMQNQLHTSILYEGHLYGIDGNMDVGARLKCIEWSSGKLIWSVDDLRPGGLSLAGGKLLLLTEAGELMVAPAASSGWKPSASGQVLQGKCWTVPVLSGGRVYCRSIDGQVACVDCRE
ncbi:MAG: PQQ-binding-like beta-propeller repeat protein [Planctomycetaceae bacterium]